MSEKKQWRVLDSEMAFPFSKIYEGDRDVATCWDKADADRIVADHNSNTDAETLLGLAATLAEGLAWLVSAHLHNEHGQEIDTWAWLPERYRQALKDANTLARSAVVREQPKGPGPKLPRSE